MENQPPRRGMGAFFTIWTGQLVSLVGSQLTSFALGVWVYDQTRSVLLLAITQVASQIPVVVLSPLAGVFADRWNRRTAMVVSDFGAGLAVLAAGLLYIAGQLQPWMVVLVNLWMATFNTLMWPSYTAAVTLLVRKKQYGRINGLVQLGEALPQIAGPAIAGALYVAIHLGYMALIDAATYAFSVLLMLLFVRIPRPEKTEEGRKAEGSIWKEMRFGWDYIVARKGLLSLQLFFFTSNFLTGVIQPLIVPLIMDTWNAEVLGFLMTILGVGVLAGTLVMSAWGGGKRKMYTLLGASLMSSLFMMGVGLRASIPLVAVTGFGIMFFGPLLNASSQAIWQAKVAPDVQGRVFAVRRAISWSANLVTPLLAAPLADYIFKPGMAAGGWLARILSPLFEVGASRGVGVMFSLVGLLSALATIVAAFYPRIRRLELELPDHEAARVPEVENT